MKNKLILKWSKKNIVKYRKTDREYQADKRKRIKGYKTKESRKYKNKYPEKVKAHQLLNTAIKNGKIKRSSCVKCKIDKNIHGHHPDYNKPYQIIWLCPVHHKEIHLIK